MDSYVMTGRTMDEQPTYRATSTLYLSYQGKRRGNDALQGTPNLIRQDDENVVEIEDLDT